MWYSVMWCDVPWTLLRDELRAHATHRKRIGNACVRSPASRRKTLMMVDVTWWLGVVLLMSSAVTAQPFYVATNGMRRGKERN